MPLSAPEENDDKLPVTNGFNATTIQPICADLAARVNTFLETEAPTPLLQDVQKQTRIAMGVIEEALERYRLVQKPVPN